MVFSSPDKKNYADILKKNTIILYMPLWTDEEIKIVGKELKLDEQKVLELCSKFGGIPRYVLCTHPTRREQQLQELHTACEEMNSPDVLISIGARFTNNSHKVFHLIADQTYTKACLDFASTYVERKVFASLKKTREDNVCKFLEAASENLFFATLRGKMFESHSHETLPQEGEVIMQRLQKQSHDVTFPLKLQCRTTMFFSTLEEVARSENRAFYMRPYTANFMSFDAVIPCEKSVYQITVSNMHPVKAAGLTNIMVACGWAELSLVFVVPNDTFKFFPFQTITGKLADNLTVKQYALCIDLKNYCKAVVQQK